MVIDCERCEARGAGCADCVVTVLLGPPEVAVHLPAAEQVAIATLADGGLVPPLRWRPAPVSPLPGAERSSGSGPPGRRVPRAG